MRVRIPDCIAGLVGLGLALSPTPGEAADGTAVYKLASRSVVIVLQGNSQGSGVLLSSTIAVTNCHVVDTDAPVVLRFVNTTRQAQVVARNTGQDVCVLQLERAFEDARPVTAVRLASGVEPGEQVYTIGAPIGLTYSLTGGYVSQLRRHEGGTVIQFDASISSGNSGGGLFDQRGVLLGLTSFSRKAGPLSGAMIQNLNFAWAVDNFPPPASALVKTLAITSGVPQPVAPSSGAGVDFSAGRTAGGALAQQWKSAYDGRQWTLALAAATKWISLEPLNAQAHLARGKTKEARRPGSGLADFETALGLQHGHPEALLLAARSAKALGDASAFIRYRDALKAVSPRLVDKI